MCEHCLAFSSPFFPKVRAYDGSPPPNSSQGISRWEALPPANRQRLLWLLSHLLERQLERGRTPGKEDDDELDANTE